MRRRSKAALAPTVVMVAFVGAAGSRAQGSGSGRRLDGLSQVRPAAATHVPIEGAISAAGQAALKTRWIEGRTKAPARTGRTGGSRGTCDPGSIVQRESKGDPNAVNPSSGAGGKYQFLPRTSAGHGGYARAQDAPESVQDERFDQVWAGGAGSSHWGC